MIVELCRVSSTAKIRQNSRLIIINVFCILAAVCWAEEYRRRGGKTVHFNSNLGGNVMKSKENTPTMYVSFNIPIRNLLIACLM